MNAVTAAIVASLALATLACRGDARDRDRDGGRAGGGIDLARRDSSRALGPGDIRIVNADTSIELALVGDWVATGLSERALAKVRQETDTGAVKGKGFGANIERLVKSSVQSALSTEVRIPLSEIADARFEGGRLVFLKGDGSELELFRNTKVNGRTVAESFRPDDAEEFVSRLRARKRVAK